MQCETICPLCPSQLLDPRKLSCGHSFCPVCVSGMRELALSEGGSPVCPVCSLSQPLFVSSESIPSCSYHLKVLARFNSSSNSVCMDCDNIATFFCREGCGLLCLSCKNDHARRKSTSSHNTKPLRNEHSDLCVNHEHPIVKICTGCWPVVEMCSICAGEDSERNPHHSHVALENISYASINEDALYSKVVSSRIEAQKTKVLFSGELEKVALQQKQELERIEKLYREAISKIEYLKNKLIDETNSMFEASIKAIKVGNKKAEDLTNLLEHCTRMIKESKEAYAKHNITSRLVKSKLFCEKVLARSVSMSLSELSNDTYSGSNLANEKGAVNLSLEHVKLRHDFYSICEIVSSPDGWMKSVSGKDSILSSPTSEPENETVSQLQYGNGNSHTGLSKNIVSYTFVAKVGSKGIQQTQFDIPYGIAVNPKTGDVYVTEQGKSMRVQVFDKNLVHRQSIWGEGSTRSHLMTPSGIAVSQTGVVAVCEEVGNRIQILDARSVKTIQTNQNKSKDCKQKETFDGFSAPKFVCFDATGNIYVANYGKDRVDKFNAQLDFERSFAHASLGDCGVEKPMGICVTVDNHVCVVGQGSEFVRTYTTEGVFIKSIKAAVRGNVAIAQGPNKTILVSDSDSNIINIYHLETGKKVGFIGTSQRSLGDGQFNKQLGVCFGPNQMVYVCDKGNNRIQSFSP